MSRGMRLSILGLYHANSNIFADMVYPSGFTNDEKNTVIGNILAECAELECLFPDPAVMQTMVGLWSKLNISVWERIFSASKLNYNPIENYNRTEIETVTDDRTETHSGNDINKATGTDSNQISNSNTQTNTGTDTRTLSENNSGTDTTTNKIASYDSNSLYIHDTSDFKHGHNVSGSDSMSYGHNITDSGTGSSSTTYGKTETLTHGEKITHEGDITKNNHTTGNIGVTTSQQMLEQEIEVSAKLNVIKMIVNSFKDRFCLLVY